MDDRFKRSLHRAGHSVTAPRSAVFDHLQKRGPTRPSHLFKQIKNVDRASLYRTIKLFKDLGLIHEVGSGSQANLELSEQFDQHHHHLTCLGCGRSTVTTDPGIEQRLTRIAHSAGFKPVSHQVEISGYCHKCQR